MSYTTLQNLTNRYGTDMLIGLTDRADIPTGQIDTDVVDRALDNADALINGFLAARIALPMADTPALVKTLAEEIAIYKLHNGHVPPMIEADYKMALKSLESIARGLIKLPGTEGIEPAGTGGTGARLTDRARPMSESDLKGYI